MKNKKNLMFVGVITVLVLVVIILLVLLMNGDNSESVNSTPKQTESTKTKLEKEENQSTEGESEEEDSKKATMTTTPESKAAADADTADVLETLIAKELAAYVSGNTEDAVADTDREMYSYSTVNDILRNAKINHGKNTFEQKVKESLNGLTTETDGETLIWPKQEGQVFWVLITGTYAEGYQIKVQTSATDFFANERKTYDDIELSFYYKRKDKLYDADTCSLAFWYKVDNTVKYYFFDEDGRVTISVPEDKIGGVGFFIKDVKGSRTASANGNSGIVKFVEDKDISLIGQKGNTLNIHIDEGVYADDETIVSQEWFLKR